MKSDEVSHAPCGHQLPIHLRSIERGWHKIGPLAPLLLSRPLKAKSAGQAHLRGRIKMSVARGWIL
jgi:hypothetical protein